MWLDYNRVQMKIEHISISRDGCYQECQQKYKFRYHLKTASPEPEPIYFAFGKTLHKIIEEHTRAKGSIELSKVAKDVLTGKIELEHGKKAPRYDAEHQNKLIRMLGHYKRLVDKIGYEGEIEWKFDVDMDGNGRKMTGFIDRMIRKGDEFFLLDYKTTKVGGWRKNERTIGSDLQLMCYCYVVMNHFKVPASNIRAALFYLDDNKLVPTKFNEQALLSVPQKLLATYKEIEEMNPDKVYGNVGRHCTRCDYRSLCPFYALT